MSKRATSPLTLRLGCFTKTLSPVPRERIGWGAIGFVVRFDGQGVVNPGDTLLEREAWKAIEPPDVLMAPVGGATAANGFFSRSANPADPERFRAQVEAIGSRCVVLEAGGRLASIGPRIVPMAANCSSWYIENFRPATKDSGSEAAAFKVP